MPPRWAPRAYTSCGASLMRRPGIRNERGTQVGASRSRPSPASRACRTWAAPACAGASAGLALAAVGEVFLAIRDLLHREKGGADAGRAAGSNGVIESRPCRAYRRQGWDVYQVQSGPELRRLARMLEANLTIVDVALLEETGWLTCAKLTHERPEARVILVTDNPTPRDQDLAEFVGASALV